jgi:uncharacterized protein (DUF952 family)
MTLPPQMESGADLTFLPKENRAQSHIAARKPLCRFLGALVLAAADRYRLGEALRFEPSRGGALFPHLYATLPLDAVVWAKPLPLLADGNHDFAGLLG